MKPPLAIFTALLLAPPAPSQSADSPSPDLALQPAHVIVSPWREHIPPTRRQGVAGIERTAKGRLWAIYGRDVESLMIDERDDVTYPDGVQAEDGTIYLVYDYHRTPEGIIHMATFREEDVRAGRQVTDTVRLRVLIDRLPSMKP